MRELLLTSLGGSQYGIWKDTILSVRGMHELHRIPLSPARIAGIMIEEGQSITLGDLSVCIGYGPFRSTDQGHILLVPGGEIGSGFVVGGELRTLHISAESVFPLPEYLKSPIFDSCAVHESIPIPVINIAGIDSVVFKPGKEPYGKPETRVGARPQDISAVEHVRVITAAGERYAVPATDGGGRAVKPGAIAPLPDGPPYLRGVTFRDGQLLTVIDLARCINSRIGAPSASVMLIATIANASFGFLIDSDESAVPAKTISIKALPSIARSAWMKHGVLRTGEIIPLVDLAMALSADSGVADEEPVWQRYAPDSTFPDIFHVQEVGVVEFSLLGVRYAMPKMEVEEVIAYKPCRPLSNVPPIVIGVVEHNGEILPVVDLAMMYGRRSLAAPGWRMILVNNGNFRALAITEAMFGERRLPPEMHRSVPIHLPHKLMYGCYPDDKAVRIILNVEAISVHFDKALVQGFVPALSEAMRTSPAGVVYTFPENAGADEDTSGQPRSLAGEIPARTQAEPVPDAVPAEESCEKIYGPAQQAEAAAAEFAGREEAIAGEPATVPEQKSGQSYFSAAAETSAATQGSPAADELNAEAELEYLHVETARSVASESATAAAENPQPGALPEFIADAKPSGEGNDAGESAAFAKKSPPGTPKAAVKKKPARKVSASEIPGSLTPESIISIAGANSSRPVHPNLEAQQPAKLSGNEARGAHKPWKIGFAYGAAVALLVGIFYISKTPESTSIETSSRATGPAETAKALVQPEQSTAAAAPPDPEGIAPREQAGETRTGAERAPKMQALNQHRDKPAANEQAKRTLVLSPLTDEQTEHPAAKASPAPLKPGIPASRPVETEVYVVQDGDTLWGISAQFTGSPRNYPRIAGENGIANPELIFPGQRLRLAK